MLSKNNILLGTAIIGAFLCSFNSFIGFRAIVVFCLILLAFSDKYSLTYPIALFFYTQFGTFAGLSILRLFSLLLILNFLIYYRGRKKIDISGNNICLLSIYY